MADVLRDDAPGMGASVEDLANLFYRAATDTKPKRRYFNNFHDRLTVMIARSFPGRFRKQVLKGLNQNKK